ncbi:hypothetical protein ACLUWO_00945 [Pseudoscardovia radai]|uniref:hypothetical protein n=1 Tax=Pseudoscardovia radai TaxID=987066 RepID=UPI0039946F6C
MALEKNRALGSREKRTMRWAVLVIVAIAAVLLVLTATDLLMRTTGFIVIYSVIIVLCIALLATVLRDDAAAQPSVSGSAPRSEDQVIADAMLSLKVKQDEAKQDEATRNESEADAQPSEKAAMDDTAPATDAR